jgi:acetyl-CoA C-acetyltransferase
VAIKAGCGDGCVAMTVNKACGSSLKAIDLARAAILLDGRKVVVAGGMESMTNIPFLLPDFRNGYRLGHVEVKDGNYQDGFTCGILGEPMGMTAEYLADDYKIGRGEQDEYALRSHQRAEAAQKAGRFGDEIAPVTIQGKKAAVTVATDEHVRQGVALDDLQRLPPVFRPKVGTVHAGNSSGITDGGAALVLMPASEVARRGLRPLAWLGASATAGVAPRIMGIGPVPAARAALAKAGMTLDAMDLIEVNEAFATQALAVQQELGIPMEKFNRHGGAIAIGHPLGASGARIAAHLTHALRVMGKQYALGSACIGGGQGIAMVLESLE